MALGDVFSPNFIIEKVTVKANEDIEKGEFVCNDGNGFVAATAALAALNRPGVALDAHDYSEETDHTIRVLFEGVVEAQKKPTRCSLKVNITMQHTRQANQVSQPETSPLSI